VALHGARLVYALGFAGGGCFFGGFERHADSLMAFQWLP
jgi:hypothetical protein